jgi:hypothetical protein
MSLWSRVKSLGGGDVPPTVSIPAGTTALELLESTNLFFLNAASAVTIGTINATGRILPGRQIVLVGVIGTGAVTITNNAGTTTKGQIDAGAADLTVDDTDVVTLIQVANGTWLEVSSTDN